MGAIERAKQVTPPEMNSIIRVGIPPFRYHNSYEREGKVFVIVLLFQIEEKILQFEGNCYYYRG